MQRMISVILFMLISRNGQGKPLQELVQHAIKNRPHIAAQKRRVQLSHEQSEQALGAFYPEIDVQTNHEMAKPIESDSLYNKKTQLSIEQSFNLWGSEFEELKAIRTSKEIALNQLEQSELDLASLVAKHYYGLLRDEHLKKNYLKEEQLLNDRLEVLKERERIGRSKLSDLLAARVQMARVETEQQRLVNSAQDHKKQLQWLTGIQSISFKKAFEIDQLEKIVKFEFKETPRIKVYQAELKKIGHQIAAQRSQFFPKLSLGGNYYVEPLSNHQRSWDVQLSLSMNLYRGGQDRAQLKQLLSQRFIKEQKLIEEINRVKSEQERLGNHLQNARIILDKLKTAINIAEKHYEAQKNDFELGLVTSLEVIRSLDEFLDIKRSYIDQLYTAKNQRAQLMIARGELP